MNSTNNQKVTVSLPADVLNYADAYKKSHGLNRSEVLTLALKLLRERELGEGYRALAEEEKQNPNTDSWVDSDTDETLKQTEWR